MQIAINCNFAIKIPNFDDYAISVVQISITLIKVASLRNFALPIALRYSFSIIY